MVTVEITRIYPVKEVLTYCINDINKAIEFAQASYNKPNVIDVKVY